jgi:hypothetical protein
MKSHIIRTRLEELPEELEDKALDYIESLLQESGGKVKKGKFRFDWRGGLSHLKEKYTSVELQHKSSEWR